MVERQEYFLYGGSLDLHGFDGNPLLVGGRPAAEGLVNQDASGRFSIRLNNQYGGGAMYPLDRVVGTEEDVRQFQIEYRQKVEEQRSYEDFT